MTTLGSPYALWAVSFASRNRGRSGLPIGRAAASSTRLCAFCQLHAACHDVGVSIDFTSARKPPSKRLRLADLSRRRLRQLGADPEAARFVCPMCLRLLPDSEASVGHFPADALRSGAQTELQCRACNQAMNVLYEKSAQDFLTGKWGIEIGLPDTGRVHLRGIIGLEGETFSIRPAELSKKGERELNAMMARAHDGSTLNLRVHEPTRDALHRSLLAWSFLAWSKCAGYMYSASAGAARVRTLLLDANQCLPPTLILGLGTAPLSLPLPRPEAVVLAASEVTVVTSPSQLIEVFGLGMHWGRVVVVLPFASDGDGAVYERLAGLHAVGRMGTLHFLSIQDELTALEPHGTQRAAFMQDLVSDQVFWITQRVDEQDVIALASGQSPYVMPAVSVSRQNSGSRTSAAAASYHSRPNRPELE